MSRRSEGGDWEERRSRIIGLGERSIRKSYYPELRRRLEELERFRALLDRSRDLIFLICLPEGRLTYVSNSVCRGLEQPREELLDGKLRDFLPDEDWERILSLSEAAEEGGDSDRIMRTELQGASGGMPVELSLQPVGLEGQAYAVVVARDLSRRIGAEQRLRVLSSMVAQHSLAMAIARLDGRITYANRSWRLMHGYGEDETLEGEKLAVFHTPEQLERDVKPFNERVMASGTASGEVGHVTCDGREFPTLMTTTLVRDERGEPICLAGSARDISDRKRMEEELRRERDRASTYLEMAGIVFVALDPEGRVTQANRKCCDVLGCSRDEIVGRDWFESFLAEDGRERHRSTFEEIMSGERELPEYYENDVHTCSGEIRRIAWHNTILRKDSGAVTGTLSSGEDITDRLRAERALEESERRYRRLVENLGEGIAIADLDENFTFANRAAERVFGVGPGGLTGKNLRDFIGAEAIGSIARQTAIRREGETTSYEVNIVRPDGELRNLQVTGSPQRDAEGRVTGTMGIIRDVTDLKRARREHEVLREQLAHAQKMEAIGRLAGGVAHDFNNTLSVILGYGEMLLDTLPEGAPSREKVQQMVDAGHRSSRLTRKLLAFSRKQPLKTETFDLREVVSGLERMLSGLLEEGIELSVCCGNDPLPVTADRGQLEQIVVNLAVNSRDAMPEGGRLGIGAEVVELTAADVEDLERLSPGAYARLSVSDEGCGMDEETVSRIFEPFFTTKPDGTGLGLANVYAVVRQFDGCVRVESKPGLGTEFMVFLPIASSASEEAPDGAAPARAASWPAGLRVLVAEDEKAIRRLLKELLATKGVQVKTAGCGEEALRIMEEQGWLPDVLVTDLEMPGMGGLELARRVRENRRGTGVVYMSGYPDAAISEHGRFAEGSVFLQKPFETGEMLECIHRLLPEDRR